MYELKCPMCKGTLWVDPSSGEIVDHKSADHQRADFNEFLKNQKNRGSQLEDKFKQAKEEQKKRKAKLDEEFRKAREHPEDLKGDISSPFGWD